MKSTLHFPHRIQMGEGCRKGRARLASRGLRVILDCSRCFGAMAAGRLDRGGSRSHIYSGSGTRSRIHPEYSAECESVENTVYSSGVATVYFRYIYVYCKEYT